MYSHTVVRERHSQNAGERASGKHYSDSCSRGSDYTGKEEKASSESREVGGIKRGVQSLICNTDTGEFSTKCVFSLAPSELAGRWG